MVYRSRDIRPDLGSQPGKGEAMWKSLFVTRGDLLVFMDADLIDWDTHFVPGLLGPLLTLPEIALVKGFYERPFVEGDRVTLRGALATIAPADKKFLHGMRDAILVPSRLSDKT